jgi:ATP-binding cassette subfamily B protein
VDQVLDRVRTVVAERIILLRMLRLAGAGPSLGFAALAVVNLGAPIAMAILTGVLVGELQRTGDLGFALVIAGGIAVAIVAIQLAQSFRAALLDAIVAAVDGRVKSRVRYAASVVLPFRDVESAEFQADAARAGDPGVWQDRTRTAGAATAGQLWLSIRIVTAVGLAVLIATVNVGVAILAFLAVLVIRSIRRNEFVPIVRLIDQDAHLGHDADVIERSFAEPRYGREFSVFGFGPWLLDRWTHLTDGANEKHFTELVKVLRSQWLSTAISIVFAVATFGWLGLDALSGRIETPQLALALMGLANLTSMAGMGQEAFDIDYGLSSVRAYHRIEDRMRAAQIVADAPRPPETAPVVEFAGVAFSYDDRPVLSSVDLRLAPGERLAIVGRNGAGKSTLTKLLGGLYTPSAGSVTFDGVPTSEPEGLAAATASVAVMYQESLRLPLDVRGNVTMGAEAPDDAVWAALDIAGLATVFRREGVALDTPLWNAQGESRDLSGGQWQRIALARAVFAAGSGKRVLVLDEPTSQFDVAGETAFYDEVMAALPGITVVLITHRLSTIRRADRIAMLEGGRITEIGSHRVLMDSGGAYATMFRLQAERFAESR